MDITWNTSLITALSPILTIPLMFFLLKNWIIKRLQYSIKYEYDSKLAKAEHNREVRLKAELVSELLSEWINKNEDKQRLNELTFKAFLWLPPEIASDLSKLLSHKPDSPDVRGIVDRVRKHLLGKDDTLESHQIIIFNVFKNAGEMHKTSK